MFNNPTLMMWSLLFGGFGMGFFVYGKRQRSPVPFVVGILLMVYTFFVTNVYLVVIIGVVLIILPYFVRLD